MALRRENDDLRSELQKLQNVVSQLTSKPESNETDALVCLGQLSDSGLPPTPDSSQSTMVAQGYSMADYRLHQSVRLIPSNKIASESQAGLTSNYSKAYPQILSFENPQSIARDLLGPSTPSRLDGILR